jgi:formylglycine-generating enzyme required for sulfatase activity
VAKGSEEPGNLAGFRRTTSPHMEEKEKKNSLKLHELCGNVYENKGSAFQSSQETGNVIENTSSYAFEAGMLLKTSKLSLGLEFCRSGHRD